MMTDEFLTGKEYNYSLGCSKNLLSCSVWNIFRLYTFLLVVGT